MVLVETVNNSLEHGGGDGKVRKGDWLEKALLVGGGGELMFSSTLKHRFLAFNKA
jgi:hypothetical protein